MIKNSSVIDLLKQVTLFQNTPDDVLEELESHIKLESYAADDHIITKGEEGDEFYIIASGSVKVHDEGEVVAVLNEGNFFGEISLLDSAPRSMSVSAVDNVQLYTLSSDDFYKVFKRQPEVTKVIVSTLTRRLRRQNETSIEQLRNREEELTRLVNERTAELSMKNQKLEETLRELKIAEEQLEKEKEVALEAKQKAEDAKKFQEQFLANMSHEIRTPMNAVIGMTNLLLNTTSPTPPQLKYLKAIKISSENLLTILNDILDLSKIEAGKIELESITFSLPEVLETVRQTLHFKAEEKALALNVKMEGEGYEYLVGDPVRLNQVLINLAGNAIKFTEKGGITINCRRLSTTDGKAQIEFNVIDTGIGIPANKLDSIFESFSQVSAETTRKYGGTGLGLTISKQLIEIHGGTVSVSSELGKGTTFTVLIPYAISTEAASRKVESAQLNDDTIRQLAQLRVLLAEDNQFNQIVAIDTMQSLIPGITVEVANNGKEAVDMLAKNEYDLVLMDIQMPEMNGYEASRYIRDNMNESKRNIHIVAMTANVTQSEKDKCVESGMSSYLAKPFKPEELLAKLASIGLEIKKVVPGGGDSKPKFTISEKTPSHVKMADMTFLNTFTKGDKTKIAKYVNMFLQSAPEQLELMTTYLKAGNYDRLRGTAHALKPQITYMGIHAGENLIKEIEKFAAEQTQVEKLPTMLEEFLAICNEAIPELKEVASEGQQ